MDEITTRELYPINVYIDTCSLINLLNEGKAEFLINNLEFWIDNNRIKLFTHIVIIKEWNEHKEIERKSFFDSQNAKYKHAREIIKKENLIIDVNLEPKTEAYDKLIEKIDKFLNNAIKFEASVAIKAKSSDRNIKPRKAPFHNNSGSVKDAYIIFSALEYFHKQSQSFVFISDNKNDFASPENLDRKIHPELIEDYEGIQIEYYKEIGRAINDFRKKLDISYVIEDNSMQTEQGIALTESETAPAYKNTIDRNLPLLDQLVNYLELIHTGIAYVPPRILINQYPFKIGNENSVYYSIFNAETSNENLIKLVEKINLSEDGKLPGDLQASFPDIEMAQDKCLKIVSFLTRDLIFQISNRKGNKSFSTLYSDKQKCNCPVCEFKRFRFIDSFKQLSDKPKNEEESLLLAYANYQAGNYFRATEILQYASHLDPINNKKTSSFIIQFNLSKLPIFLSNHYYGKKAATEKINELKNIIPEDLIKKYTSSQNSEILNLISGSKFYTEAKEKILDLHYKILDTYHESLRGSYNSNNYIWALKNYYAEIDYFLNCNRIVFDRFNEFSNLSDRVFEAILASHAIKESNGSRLPYFDDWTLQQIILYGNADNLNKFYSRYKLKKLSYQNSDNEDIFKLVMNLFAENEKLRDAFIKYCENDNRSFWNYYNKLFSNALTVISITEFSMEDSKALYKTIVEYLLIEDYIHKASIKHIRILVNRVGKSWDVNILIQLLWITIKNRKYHGENCTEAIFEVLYSHEISLDLSDIEYESIYNAYLTKDDDGLIKEIDVTLLPLSRLFQNDSRKVALNALIQSYIRDNFNFGFYYLAVIYEIIPYDDNDFEKLIDCVLPTPNRQKIKGDIFGRPGDRFEGVNDFLNLCFKLKLDTLSDRFAPVRNLGQYYSWLLDMENFDYSNFDPLWINEYKTRFYLRRIANSDKVKSFIESHLKEKTSSELETQYYNIYVRKVWSIQEEE